MRFSLVPLADKLAAKLEHQTKELEKQHSQFHRHFQHMDSRAVKQKELVTKLEDHCERMVRRNVKLEIPAITVGQQTKESEERHEEMEQTEAVVVDTEAVVVDNEESGESSPNQSNTGFPMA